MAGYLYLALTVLLRTAMRSVFEKYRILSKEISEEKHYESLVPDLYKTSISDFAEMMKDAYGNFSEKICPNARHNESKMKAMLSEYYEIYLSILNIANYLVDEQPAIDSKTEIAEEFIERLHAECKKHIEHAEEPVHSLQIMFTRTNMEQLVKLGFLEEKSTVTKEVFHKVLAETRSQTDMNAGEYLFTDAVIDERKSLFQEVYADCGMCCAIGFDPFGYCMFTISVHNMVGGLNAIRKSSSFLADRIHCVVKMFFSEDKKEQWPEIVEGFFHKLFDVRMIKSICEMLLAVQPSAEIQNIMEYSADAEFKVQGKNTERMFTGVGVQTLINWQKDIAGALLQAIEKDYSDKGSREFIDKLDVAKSYLFKIKSLLDLFISEKVLYLVQYDDFNGFLQQLRKQMLKGKSIQSINNDPYVKTISQFFNINDSVADRRNSKFNWYYNIYVEGFVHQCNFIFKNYCKYRNAYNKIIREIDLKKSMPINEWFDILDNYYTEEAKS